MKKIAETSSKGNQEKWRDDAANCWYKLDQFGYEALAETVISALLEQSGLESDTPVYLCMIPVGAHTRSWAGENRMRKRKFSEARTILITLNRLLTGFWNAAQAKAGAASER